jgi:hypothetical protein
VTPARKPRWGDETGVRAWVDAHFEAAWKESRDEEIAQVVAAADPEEEQYLATVEEPPVPTTFWSGRWYVVRTGKRGRPKGTKMSDEWRRDRTGVHAAAQEFPIVVRVLKRDWPREKVRVRALEVACARCGVEDTRTLTHYLNRSLRDRRRVEP